MATRKTIALSVLTVLALLLAARLYFAYHSQPQLPPSDELYRTVDALFTAVTAHDSHRLAACQQRLEGHKDRGALPPAAAKRLDRIIALANSGDWNAAARQLYDFIQAQQRTVGVAKRSTPQTARGGTARTIAR